MTFCLQNSRCSFVTSNSKLQHWNPSGIHNRRLFTMVFPMYCSDGFPRNIFRNVQFHTGITTIFPENWSIRGGLFIWLIIQSKVISIYFYSECRKIFKILQKLQSRFGQRKRFTEGI